MGCTRSSMPAVLPVPGEGTLRRIDYLRISVTDRCNLKCVYCMPAAGVNCMEKHEVLSTTEIVRFVQIAYRYGLRKVRITGGEPLVRGDILSLIRALKQDVGIRDLSITTNGLLLEGMAEQLKHAGLDRVNVSLDTMDPERYRNITRGGALDTVWRGIEAAVEAGLAPLKINMVPLRGINDDEVRDFARLTYERDFHIRFIEFMPTGGNAWRRTDCVTSGEVRAQVASLGRLTPLLFRGGGPSRNYRLSGARGVIGFISPVSDHFCGSCNRLRLSADGKLRPCLFSDQIIDVRPHLRRRSADRDLADLIEQAVRSKPAGHFIERLGTTAPSLVSLSQIGG
ncbi:MAG: GTP 3',8-cyclase MoaA [Nitrospirota bacterium]|nr:GTP 3',8-cyclase MoaA [Nitrospirota bacterium]